MTGAHGFIGRHLARHLAELGHVVCGIGHGAWPLEEARAWGIKEWLRGEIDSSNLSDLVASTGIPDRIYHLAGGSSVGLSVIHPLEDYRRTVDTSARLLDWSRLSAPHTQLVCVSSAAVYGPGHRHAIPETVERSPCSPYGVHKAMMEMMCESYMRNYGLRIAIARLFSVYGAGLEKQFLWDLCCKLRQNAGAVSLDGTGSEARDWIHISDVVRLLSAIDGATTVVNGGCGSAMTVGQIAEMTCASWGHQSNITFTGRVRKGDPELLVANISRLAATGFEPLMPLSTGIHEYVTWFRTRSAQ